MELRVAHPLLMCQQMDNCSQTPAPLVKYYSNSFFFCCQLKLYLKITKQQKKKKQIPSAGVSEFSFLLLREKRCRPLRCSVVKALVLFQQQCCYPTVSDGSKVVFSSQRIHLHYANEQLIWIFSPPMNILHSNLPSK